MYTYRDTSAKVRNNKIHILIELALLFGIPLGNSLLVKSVEDRDLLQEFLSRYPCNRLKLIHNRRVHHNSRDIAANLLGYLLGKDAAKTAGMLAILLALYILNHLLRDCIDTGLDRFYNASATNHNSQFGEIHVILRQGLHNNLLSEVPLGNHILVWSQLLICMAQCLCKDLLLIIVQRDLG